MPKKAHKTEDKKTKKPRAKKKVGPKISSDDLLPESREFLKTEESVEPVRVEKIKIMNPREELHKKMIMWSGISFFMVLVLVVWIFNAKQIFQETAKNSVPAETQELGDIFQEFNSAMQNVKQGLDNLENVEQVKNENRLPVNGEADKIDELKMRLEGRNRE